MALQKFTDDAGREAWVDTATNLVYTEGGTRPTNMTKDRWNIRQVDKYGKPKSSSSSKSSSNTNDFASSIVDTQAKAIKEQTKYLDQYKKNNPFIFDEELARNSATAEYDPYYTEILTDYLADIDTKRTTIQDDLKLNSTLKQYDEAAKSRDYTRAVSQAQSGYAEKGTYGGGAMDRNLGAGEVEYNADVNRGNEVYNAGVTTANRNLGVLDTLGVRKTRDVEREKKDAINSSILTRENETLKQYNAGIVMDYNRKFNPGDPSGYLVQNSLRY